MPVSSAIFMALAAISFLIWIVLTFFWGAFWQLSAFDDDAIPPVALPAWPRVIAIVPARNEAETIARTVESLVQQDYPGEFHLVVVDDHSEDQTATLALTAAERLQAANRVTILPAAQLQNGWTGKIWAMQQGVEPASTLDPEYFWLSHAAIL